jgi:hypothetical protein
MALSSLADAAAPIESASMDTKTATVFISATAFPFFQHDFNRSVDRRQLTILSVLGGH